MTYLTVTDEMVERASEQYWNDFHARRAGSSWSSRDPQEVIVIQIKATMRAALAAALQGSVVVPADVVRDILAMPDVHARLRTLDMGISTKTKEAAWLRLRDILPRHERLPAAGEAQ